MNLQKNGRGLLAMVLVVCMCLSMLNITAFAAGNEAADQTAPVSEPADGRSDDPYQVEPDTTPVEPAEPTDPTESDAPSDGTLLCDGNPIPDGDWTAEGGDHLVVVTGTWHGTITYTGNGTMTITGGGTIDASASNQSAITVDGPDAEVVLTNATVTGGIGTEVTNTNLEPRNGGKFRVGGGVYVRNGQFTLNGGTITGNTAQRGGGIFVNLGASLDMVSGDITGNRTIDGDSYAAEGGGIFVWGTAVISGGSITQNTCNSRNDLGGGGLYVNNSGMATLINAEVTGNTADGFGGGIAGCCHGEMSLVAVDGVAMYGNTAYGTAHTEARYDTPSSRATAEKIDGYQAAVRAGITGGNAKDFYTAGSCIVSNYMTGGGSANYTVQHDSTSGKLLDNEVRKYEDTTVALAADPSQDSIGRIPAGVLISGNHSTVHGGGIGCNGGLYFGSTQNTTIEMDILQLDLEAQKLLDGEVPQAGQFRFELLYKDGKTVVGTAENDETGAISFTLDEYAEIRSHLNEDGNSITFYLRERIPSAGDGIIYDKSVYRINVELEKSVEEDTVTLEHTTSGNGFQQISVTYILATYTVKEKTITLVANQHGEEADESIEDQTIQFCNQRSGSLTINKEVVGGGSEAGAQEYTFTVTGPDGYQETVSITGSGSAELTGLVPGTYTVSEEPAPMEDYTLTVQVENDGTVTVEPGQSAEITVTNTYTEMTPAVWTPSVRKEIIAQDDADFTHDAFEFTLTLTGASRPDAVLVDGQPVAIGDVADTVVVTGAGTESFREVTFTKSGEYTFEIEETGMPNGYTGETQKQAITVTVTATENGTLAAAGVPDSPCTFINSYGYGTAYYLPQVSKRMQSEHSRPAEQTFTFVLAQDETDPVQVLTEEKTVLVSVPAADQNGPFAAQFAPVTFTRTGVYHFTIREKDESQTMPGYGFSDRVYRVTVTVTDNHENGRLNTAVSAVDNDGNAVDGETFEFVNTYAPASAAFAPHVLKTVSGDPPADATFAFSLQPAEDYGSYVLLPDTAVTVLGSGEASFGEIAFLRAGTYRFQIRENGGNDAHYTYDKTVWTLETVVEDQGGALAVVRATYTPDTPDAESRTDKAEFCNSYRVLPGTLVITKAVVGGGSEAVEKTYTFTVTGPNGYQETVTIQGAGSASLENLVPGRYIVTEQDASISGYVWTVTGNGEATITEQNTTEIVITNTYEEQEPETTSVCVQKVWREADGTEATENLPESITVTLFNGITEVATAVLDASNGWSHTWTGLDADGDYSVSESHVAGWSCSVNGYTITNTREKQEAPKGSLTIRKVVSGGSSEIRTGQIFTFDITGPDGYANTVTITGENSVTLSDLAPGNYTVAEQDASVSGYVWTVTGNGEAAVTEQNNTEIVITNTYEKPEPETTSVHAQKFWRETDGTEATENLPESITVTLFNGHVEVDTVVLDASNGWSHTWTDLDADGDYSVSESHVAGWSCSVNGYTITNTREQQEAPKGSLTIRKMVAGGPSEVLAGQVFTFDITGPDGYASTVSITGENSITLTDLVPGSYTVSEWDASISGYVWTVSGNSEATVTAQNTAEVVLTNRYTRETPNTMSVTVTKHWEGDNTSVRPKTISVELYRNGKLYDTVTLSAENAWAHTWRGLSIAEYSVKEVDVPDGYTSIVTGRGNRYTITNTYEEPEPETTSVHVQKVWREADGTEATENLPESITVTLFNGSREAATAVLDASNGWSYTWTGLDADGDYSVSEAPVAGWVSSVDGYTITNTREKVDAPKGSLTIRKAVSGGPSEILAGQVFTFDITGPDGYATTVTVTGESSVTLTDLVPGSYTLAERDASVDGWRWSMKVTGDSVVWANLETIVTVTNIYAPEDDTPATDIPDETPPTTDIPDATPPLSDTPDVPTQDIPEPQVPQDDVPQTGDGFHPLVWTAALIVSGAGIVVAGVRRKKEDA